MGTITTTKAMREGNESGISGARAESVNNVQKPDQVISAASEEQTALASFLDHQLKAMCLICDQQSNVQLLGLRWNIVDTGVAAVGEIDVTGDCTESIFGGDLVRITGTPADDGVYLVEGAVFGAPAAATDTRITLEEGQDLPAGGSGAVGTCARVASKQPMGYAYPLTSTAVNGECVVGFDLSDKIFAPDAAATPPVRGDWVLIQNTVGNDGFYVVDAVAVVAGVTTITVNGGLLAGAEGVAGSLTKCRDKIHLEANEPFLWEEQSGQPSPFMHSHFGAFGYQPLFVDLTRGAVAYSMVENLHATINANYDARYALNPDIH